MDVPQLRLQRQFLFTYGARRHGEGRIESFLPVRVCDLAKQPCTGGDGLRAKRIDDKAKDNLSVTLGTGPGVDWFRQPSIYQAAYSDGEGSNRIAIECCRLQSATFDGMPRRVCFGFSRGLLISSLIAAYARAPHLTQIG